MTINSYDSINILSNDIDNSLLFPALAFTLALLFHLLEPSPGFMVIRLYYPSLSLPSLSVFPSTNPHPLFFPLSPKLTASLHCFHLSL